MHEDSISSIIQIWRNLKYPMKLRTIPQFYVYGVTNILCTWLFQTHLRHYYLKIATSKD